MTNRRYKVLAFLVCIVGSTAFAARLHAQIDYQSSEIMPPAVAELPPAGVVNNGTLTPAALQSVSTSNPMLYQQYQSLQVGGAPANGGCQACAAGGYSDYNRCGCSTGVFPWFNGPGACDQWCIGPKWQIDAGGIFMFRDDINWSGVSAAIGGPAPSLTDQFEHGLGGRVFLTGYNDSGFGIQVGYEGINGWNGTLAYDLGDFVADETRSFHYESQLNSVEINFLRDTEAVWKIFSGFRYVQLDEDFLDTSITDKPIPLPADPPAASAAFVDTSLKRLLKNRLFGFQLGTRRDAWQFGTRFSVSTFANAGVYCNSLRREDVDLTITTVINGDDLATPDTDEFSQTVSTANVSVRRVFADIAFVGEAGLSGTLRLNNCTAVSAGYQILALDGVSQGVDAFLFPNAGLDSSTLVFHGLQFGLEYRR